jgi:hypothetical protein
MGAAVSDFITTLVQEEVRRIVADAIQGKQILGASVHAQQVLRTYPNCGMTERDIADHIIIAAAKAGVAVEIGHVDGPRPLPAAYESARTQVRKRTNNPIGPSDR